MIPLADEAVALGSTVENWICQAWPTYERRPFVPLASTQQPALEPTSRSDAYSVRAGRRHLVLMGLILALGFLSRTWEYGRLPPSLNPDEASAGVEALNLLRYGQDRNGIPYPIKFISWGSGQDVLYAYLLIPLIGLAGLSPVTVRLPMLVAALATLPLIYAATRRVFGPGVAMAATFMLAISPWHVLLSRWALDSNLFPLIFLAGFACLSMVKRNGWWFVPACALLAMCLYTYGTAYVVVPAFMLGMLILVVRDKALRSAQLFWGLSLFAVLALPIALLLVVNRLDWDAIPLGPFTVPRFPVAVRWESVTLLGAPDVVGALASNLSTALRLLVLESDGIPYNVVEPYGIFYRSSLVLAIAGVALTLVRPERPLESRLLLLWLAAAACVAILSTVNINRFNIIFIPMIMLGAHALHQLQRLHSWLAPLIVLAFLAAFVAFTTAYHGAGYRGVANFKFQNGLIPALLSAQEQTDGPLCVTDEINMPYIYALFTEPISPSEFQATVKYVDPSEPLRRVASFGRYTFGTPLCLGVQNSTYVLRGHETPPRMGNRYDYEFFDNFVVYTPIR